ncbi:RWP-RK domain [Sesbania bispinosa]|nr:RWP-RK domain [Sesbania bispinosa]
MADPRFVVPYNDPYESPFSPTFFNLDNPIPTLADLSNNNAPIPTLTSLPQQNHFGLQQGQSSNLPPFPPVQDHYMHDNNNDNNFSFGGGATNFEAGPSQLQMDANENMQDSQNNQNLVFTLDYWPPTPLPFLCTCCQVLREIIHTNGFYIEKLEIHGRLGIITHAIHHPNINGDPSNNPPYQMIDFCKKNIEEIRLILEQYCVERNTGGCFMVQDPMSAYYEALCTGLDWTEDLSDDLADNNQNNSDGQQVDGREQEGDTGTTPRPSLAEQRERAAKMTLNDLSDYFHLPIDKASKRVNLCPTVVKKVCRKGGLGRWPYRKVKSIMKQITILGRALESGDAGVRRRAQAEINRLEQEMVQACGGVAPTALHSVRR